MDNPKDLLEQLLSAMGFSAEVVATEDDERVLLEVKGPDTSLVIGKKGQTLDAIQYLVNRMASRGQPEGDFGKPVHVDAEGYRSRRAESLIELAHRLAEKVKESGKPAEADAMSAADRRVMHLALASTPGVTTRSEGEGIYRHLVIFPTGE